MKAYKYLIIIFLFISSVDIKAQFTLPGVNAAPNPVYINGTSTNGIYIGKGLSQDFRNIGIGYGTLLSTSGASNPQPSYNNVAVGYYALSAGVNARLNVAIGGGAMQNTAGNSGGSSGSNNVAIGSDAMLSNVNGFSNVGIGYQALKNAINETNNTSVGVNSMASAGTVFPIDENVSIGSQSSQKIQSSRNTVVGSQSFLNHNAQGTESGSNSVFGYRSMESISSGTYNASFGALSMKYYGGGDYNAVFGAGSLQFGTGDYNSAFGASSMNNITTGSYNVGIGYLAAVPSGAASNQLSIQNVIFGTGMNSTSIAKIGIGVNAPSEQLHTTQGVRFQGLINGTVTNLVGIDANGKLFRSPLPAGPAVTTTCFTLDRITKSNAAGNLVCSQIYDNGNSVGIGPLYNTPAANFSFVYPAVTGGGIWYEGNTLPASSGIHRLAVDGTVKALGYLATSDGRYKKNITTLTHALDRIKLLRGVSYEWNKEAFPGKDFNGGLQIGFIAQEVEKVISPLVAKDDAGFYSMNYTALIPVLTEGIKEQQSEIELLKEEIKDLKNKLNQLIPGNVKMKEENFQIVPNPVSQNSTVNYTLNLANSFATFIVYDLQGKMLKQYPLSKNAKGGEIQLNKKDFGTGMYILTLIENGKEIESKKFIVL